MTANSIKRLIKSLGKRRFDVSYYESVEEARAGLLEKIAPGASVGVGGSMTIQQLNLVEDLKKRGCPVIWHWFVPRKSAAKLAAKRPPIITFAAQTR